MIISDVDTGCVLMVISGIKVSWPFSSFAV